MSNKQLKVRLSIGYGGSTRTETHTFKDETEYNKWFRERQQDHTHGKIVGEHEKWYE